MTSAIPPASRCRKPAWFTPDGPCETAIAIRYMNGRCTSRLAFLADRPGFVWQGPATDHPIDTHLFAKLKALRINPSGPVERFRVSQARVPRLHWTARRSRRSPRVPRLARPG